MLAASWTIRCSEEAEKEGRYYRTGKKIQRVETAGAPRSLHGVTTKMPVIAECAKNLARNPLGIIALFIVLVYGFASLMVGFSGKLTANERAPVIWFLVVFPVLVLFMFSWLVSHHHAKLYSPADFRQDARDVDVELVRRGELAVVVAGATVVAKVRQIIEVARGPFNDVVAVPGGSPWRVKPFTLA